jgi:hypothetical protein
MHLQNQYALSFNPREMSSIRSPTTTPRMLALRITKTTLHIGKEIYTHLTRSSFPELGHNTNLSYMVCTQDSYSHLQLALHVLTNSMHKASSSTLSRFYYVSLLTSPRFLFIHYKMGLNMGKPMGRHPIPIT